MSALQSLLGKIQDGRAVTKKSKMAANVEFTNQLRPALIRAKSNCLEKVSTGEGIRRVNGFFSELESAAESLQDKFCQQLRFEKVHKLLPSAGMVAKGLRKMHQKIIHRLHVKPKLAKPWFGEFVMDMPSEVFSCLSEGTIQRTNFGHKFIESNTQLIFKIKDIRKANYLFARMDIDGAEVDRNSLLKKKFQDSLERCEVIVTEDKPMELKFNKSSEVLMVTFHYGYWNQHGIPQH